MTGSQKQFTVDSNNTKVSEEIVAPVDVINISLKYDDFDHVNGHGAVSLVSTLFNSIKTQKLARLKALLTAIADGKPADVKAMLEKDPSLLLEKLEENDYVTALSGQRCNNVTAYRTVLAVEDTQIAAVIKTKLIEIAGKDAADRQYREQFPNGWEAIEAKKWEPVFTMLDTLIHVIRKSKPGDITSSGHPEYKLTVREGSAVAMALTQFRSQLNVLLNDTVTSGRHFNPHLLLKAFKIYGDHFEDYFGNDRFNPRAMIFWRQVIGIIQRTLPVNYVQAFCGGLFTTKGRLQHGSAQGRSLNIKLQDTEREVLVPTDFYPLSASRLGFDYAIYTCGTRVSGAAGRQAMPIQAWGMAFSELMSIKNSIHAPSSKTLEDLYFAR